MSRKTALYWGSAVLVIAILNIIDVLPDWVTFAAVLTLPFFAARQCGACQRKSDR